MSTITTTSAFVPFNSPPTPSLPSPPLTTYIQPHHGLPPTKLPSVFLDQRPPRYRRSNEWLFEKSSTPELRPLLQTDRDLPSFGYSLPPLQNVISSPPPPLLTDHGSPREDEDSSSSSRKGSIASILNSESDTCSSSLKRGRPRSTEPSAPKKRKCHQGSRSNNASVVNTINDNAHHQHQRQQQPVRANKGLRHFSKQVCDKVAEKGITTYNEVADELALDIRASAELEGGDKRSFDQKNIRRRVYDALNVLMAMGIIAKDKKQIKWLGISSCYQQQADYQQQQSPLGSEPEEDRYLELQRQLEEEERLQAQLLTSLDQTNGLIRDKLAQHLQVCNLVWRNQHSPQLVSEDQKIPLPFFIVACPSRKDLQVNIAGDGRSAEIEYAAADHRVVYEDADVLRHLELNRVTKDQLAACLPDPSLQSFLSVRHAADSNFINIQSEADLATASS